MDMDDMAYGYGKTRPQKIASYKRFRESSILGTSAGPILPQN